MTKAYDKFVEEVGDLIPEGLKGQDRYTISFTGYKLSFTAKHARTDNELADILQEVVNMLRAEKREVDIGDSLDDELTDPFNGISIE